MRGGCWVWAKPMKPKAVRLLKSWRTLVLLLPWFPSEETFLPFLTNRYVDVRLVNVGYCVDSAPAWQRLRTPASTRFRDLQ